MVPDRGSAASVFLAHIQYEQHDANLLQRYRLKPRLSRPRNGLLERAETEPGVMHRRMVMRRLQTDPHLEAHPEVPPTTSHLAMKSLIQIKVQRGIVLPRRPRVTHRRQSHDHVTPQPRLYPLLSE